MLETLQQEKIEVKTMHYFLQMSFVVHGSALFSMIYEHSPLTKHSSRPGFEPISRLVLFNSRAARAIVVGLESLNATNNNFITAITTRGLYVDLTRTTLKYSCINYGDQSLQKVFFNQKSS